MYYLFGHRLGTMGHNAMYTKTGALREDGINGTSDTISYNEYLRIDPGDFAIGDDITTFMNLKSGDVLTNRSGDTLEVITPYSNEDITGIYKGVITISDGYWKGVYPFEEGNGGSIYTGMKSSDPENAWLNGSYMFTYTDEDNNTYIGHPTRIHKDYIYISPNDTAGGVATINGDEITLGNYNSANLHEYIWSVFAIFCAREITTEAPDEDPFKPGGDSETGGGEGDFNGSSDTIDKPNLPNLSAVDSGFISLFNPTLAQLRQLCSYMWSDLFDLDTLKKLFADPMSAILGLSLVPVSVPFSGTRPIKIGNIETDVVMNKVSEQFVIVDCGSLNVTEYWGAYLDYDPFTKLEIYLPYIGIRQLSTDDVMNKTVNVTYHVDVLTGACCVFIRCDGSVLYTFMGQCATPIPVTGSDWTNVINGALSVVGSVASTVATGGALAPVAVSSVASAVNSGKPNIEKSGNMSGMGGMLGIQKPYLILTRPRQAKPSYQSKFMGYPSFINSKLGSLSGYTEVESIRLDNISATNEELSEIETLLKSGVII